jgi:hypothetical protein
MSHLPPSFTNHPFADSVSAQLKRQREVKLEKELAWIIPTFINACATSANANATRQARWPFLSSRFEDLAELAANRASDPQAYAAEQLAERIRERLAGGIQPEAELRDLLAYLLVAGLPSLATQRDALLDALDNGSTLRLNLDPTDPGDTDPFIEAASALASAFVHGCGTDARQAVRKLCSFIVNEYVVASKVVH